jgi:hypothetical protein
LVVADPVNRVWSQADVPSGEDPDHGPNWSFHTHHGNTPSRASASADAASLADLKA